MRPNQCKLETVDSPIMSAHYRVTSLERTPMPIGSGGMKGQIEVKRLCI